MPNIDQNFRDANGIGGSNTEPSATVSGGCGDSVEYQHPHPSEPGQHGLRALAEWVRRHRHRHIDAEPHYLGDEHAPFAEGLKGETWDFSEPVRIERRKV